MKDTLAALGLRIIDLIDLIPVPEPTIYAWLSRKYSVPFRYSMLLHTFDICLQKRKDYDLVSVLNNWETKNKPNLVAQTERILRELRLNQRKNDFALEKLQRVESDLIKRMCLAQEYPKHLPAIAQNTDNVQDWCSLLYRKAALDLLGIRFKMQKLEEKKVILAARIGYWEGVLV